MSKARNVETIEDRDRRLEKEMASADEQYAKARRNALTAIEQMITAYNLRVAARTNYQQHQFAQLQNALGATERPLLPVAL